MHHALLLILLAEAAVLTVCVVFGVTHAVVSSLMRRREETAERELRPVLARWLTEGDPADGERLCRLPRSVLSRLLGGLVHQLDGPQRDRLVVLAVRTGLAGRAERLARSASWWRRLRGVRLLSVIGGDPDLLERSLVDPVAEIRMAAAEWAVVQPTDAVIDRLIEMLGDPHALPRYAVQDALLRLGGRILPRLTAFLEEEAAAAPGAERERLLEPALEVACAICDARMLKPALAVAGAPSPRVRARAAELLGALGGGDATAALTSLLDDGSAEVRRAAARSLGKLGHWPAAPALASRLRDPDFEVRRAAGLALRSLRGPGQVMLHRMVSDRDRFAADMARQVLELPEGSLKELTA